MADNEPGPDSDKEHAWWAWWRAEGQRTVTHLLHDEWNPTHFDVPEDEYATYATRIGGLLREGASEDEIVRFLGDVRSGSLSLPAHPDEDQRVASELRDWYSAARRAPQG